MPYNTTNQPTNNQILDKDDCILHSTNTFGKGMNLAIPPPSMGKQ